MPDLQYRNTSPFGEAARAFGGLGESLPGLAIGLAQQQFQQQLAQQQMALRQQELRQQYELQQSQIKLNQLHGASYETQKTLTEAQTALANQRAKNLQVQANAQTGFGEALQYLSDLDANPNSPLDLNSITGDVMRNAGILAGGGRQHIFENLAQAREIGNPRFRQALATGTKSVVPVSSQGGLYDTISGVIQDTMPQHGTPGMMLVDPTTGMPYGQQVPFRPDLTSLARERATAGNVLGIVMNPRMEIPGMTSPLRPLYEAAAHSLTNNPSATVPQGIAPAAPTPRLLPSAAEEAPRDPAQRKAGQVYQTPKGLLKWTGTGWVQP